MAKKTQGVSDRARRRETKPPTPVTREAFLPRCRQALLMPGGGTMMARVMLIVAGVVLMAVGTARAGCLYWTVPFNDPKDQIDLINDDPNDPAELAVQVIAPGASDDGVGVTVPVFGRRTLTAREIFELASADPALISVGYLRFTSPVVAFSPITVHLSRGGAYRIECN